MTTNYTTLKLTENQVRALLQAIHICEQTAEGLDEEQLEDYGYNETLDNTEAICAKLRTAGWTF